MLILGLGLWPNGQSSRLGYMKPWVPPPGLHESDVLVNPGNLSSQQTEAGGTDIQGHPEDVHHELHVKFKTSLSYMRPLSNQQTNDTLRSVSVPHLWEMREPSVLETKREHILENPRSIWGAEAAQHMGNKSQSQVCSRHSDCVHLTAAAQEDAGKVCLSATLKVYHQQIIFSPCCCKLEGKSWKIPQNLPIWGSWQEIGIFL